MPTYSSKSERRAAVLRKVGAAGPWPSSLLAAGSPDVLRKPGKRFLFLLGDSAVGTSSAMSRPVERVWRLGTPSEAPG